MTTGVSYRTVTRCPACKSEAFDTVGREATAFRCDGDGSPQHPAYTVRCCRTCGLHYKSHVLRGEQLGAYYESLDFGPFDGDFGFPTDVALLSRLRCRPADSRVLDFGCSTGRILQALGSAYERFGVEINEAAAAEARSRGITIVTEEAVLTGGAGRFDAIVLTDVFEHLIEPTATIRMLAASLALGGEILIVTGLADAVAPRALMAEHWYFRIGGHLHMMSRRHIAWLCEEVGLRPSSIEVMSHYRSAPLQHLRQSVQMALYSVVTLSPDTMAGAAVRTLPGLKRALGWTNLPATEQRRDHIVLSLVKTEAR